MKFDVSGIVLLVVSILFAACGTLSSMSYLASDAKHSPKSRKTSMIAALVSYTCSIIFFIYAVWNMM